MIVLLPHANHMLSVPFEHDAPIRPDLNGVVAFAVMLERMEALVGEYWAASPSRDFHLVATTHLNNLYFIDFVLP